MGILKLYSAGWRRGSSSPADGSGGLTEPCIDGLESTQMKTMTSRTLVCALERLAALGLTVCSDVVKPTPISIGFGSACLMLCP